MCLNSFSFLELERIITNFLMANKRTFIFGIRALYKIACNNERDDEREKFLLDSPSSNCSIKNELKCLRSLLKLCFKQQLVSFGDVRLKFLSPLKGVFGMTLFGHLLFVHHFVKVLSYFDTLSFAI